MRNKAQHTPVPWHADRERGYIYDSDNSDTVARVIYNGDVCPPSAKADQRFIVRAANAHYGLVAALERMLADLREVRDTGLCSRRADEQILDIDAALAKARGE